MIQAGMVVRCIAGHDKDRFYVVLECGPGCAVIADGKRRRLEKPKRKNQKHVCPTKTVLDLSQISSDKKLRALLAPFNGSGAVGGHIKGGS